MNRIRVVLSVVLLAVSAPCGDAAQLLHYKFDQVDGSGPFTTPDSSGLGNTGTLVNLNNTNLVPGISGTALQFSGGSGSTANRVEVAEDDADFDRSYSEFSLAAWLKPVDAAPAIDSWIAGKLGARGNRGWQTAITGANHPTNPSQLFLGYFDAPGGAEHEVFLGPNAALANDTWIHWAVVFKANDVVKLYVNGSPVVTASGALAALNGSNNVPLQVGNRGNNQPNSWNGLIDQLYIFDHALSDAQVAALVPEPSTLMLAAAGLLLAFDARRRMR
jgi:Concanavalin A-like lectin/glucanases superfamily/PEP-CTERM motif